MRVWPASALTRPDFSLRGEDEGPSLTQTQSTGDRGRPIRAHLLCLGRAQRATGPLSRVPLSLFGMSWGPNTDGAGLWPICGHRQPKGKGTGPREEEQDNNIRA